MNIVMVDIDIRTTIISSLQIRSTCFKGFRVDHFVREHIKITIHGLPGSIHGPLFPKMRMATESRDRMIEDLDMEDPISWRR